MAKRKWSEQSALKWLDRNSSVEIKSNVIQTREGGLRGLTSCSAYDYLKNYCNYK